MIDKPHGSKPLSRHVKTLGASCVQMGANVFGIDARSLAAFRIGVAGILLLDLWYRSRDIGPFFTDTGILPRHVLISLNEFNASSGFQHIWSLHMFNGQDWGQWLLFVVAAFFAVWLLFGYRTQLAATASWVLLVSLDARNPDILNSGDTLLRCMLLWSLFLPLGSVWSLDRLIKRPLTKLPRRFVSVASVGLLMQLAMMYFFSAIAKLIPVWHTEFSGVYYAINCDAYAKPLGIAVREYDGLMKFLTAGSFGLELVGPLLVLSPLWTSRVRIVLIAAFWMFHVGLAATLTLGLFPIICIIAWTVYLPGEFWNELARRTVRLKRIAVVRKAIRAANQLGRRTRNGSSTWLARAESFRWSNRGLKAWLMNGAVGLLLIYVVLWNIRERDVKGWEERIPTLAYNGVGLALGLDQNWGMFSPIPRTEDGWLVMKGTLRDGSVVNLWQPNLPLPWEKPPVVSDTYISQRWRKYLDNLNTDYYALRRLDFCEWLGRRWNAEQANGDTTRQVVVIELYHCIEATPPPGQPFPELETRSLYDYQVLYYD